VRGWRTGFILEYSGEALEKGTYALSRDRVGMKEWGFLVCGLRGISLRTKCNISFRALAPESGRICA
jgi:hypothetical protein